MNIVKELTIQQREIEIRLAKGYQINDYQLQVINKNSHYLSIRKDKRSKTHMFVDIQNTCCLRMYLQKTPLEELPFVKLLIDILEILQKASTDYHTVISLDAIVFRQDGNLSILCLPVSKEDFISMDSEVRDFLIEVIKEVHLQSGDKVIGMLVNRIKQQSLHVPALLQELYLYLPAVQKQSFFQKIFWKQEPVQEITYPLPNIISEYASKQYYVEEIEEDDGEKTRMLFQNQIQSFLEYDQRVITIDRDTFTIGRKSNSDCYLQEPSISKEHAVIVKEADGFYLTDLQSSNATYLNGRKLPPMKSFLLHDCDQIKLADTVMQFHEHE